MNAHRIVRLFRQKKWWMLLLLLVAVFFREHNGLLSRKATDWFQSDTQDWHSGQMVQIQGVVIKQLPTDNRGSRHQRWLMQVPGRLKTLLVAHNIDLAPVIPLKAGDTVSLYGQFENNEKGGVIHWTHRDPAGRHAHGWVQHKGKIYQ